MTAGQYTLAVTRNGPFDGAIIQQLCSVDLTEYMDESAFVMDDVDAISAYLTWDASRRKTYRPSNGRCLMRNIQSTTFCSVCVENMWLRFLARMQVIVVPLGQLRVAKSKKAPTQSVGSSSGWLTVQWFKVGVELMAFHNLFATDLASMLGSRSSSRSSRTVDCVRHVPDAERAHGPKNLLQSKKAFAI